MHTYTHTHNHRYLISHVAQTGHPTDIHTHAETDTNLQDEQERRCQRVNRQESRCKAVDAKQSMQSSGMSRKHGITCSFM